MTLSRIAGAFAPAASILMLSLVLVTGCADQAPLQQPTTGGERVAMLQTELGRLEREAALLADVSAVKRLQRAYGYYLDQKMWDQMADLFAQDGSIEIALDGVYVGRKRVRQYLYALGDGASGLKTGELGDHPNLQPVITVAEDGLTAKGRWRAVLMTGELGKQAVWGEGVYENEYVKRDGVWKIASLHWYQTFMVPYEGGWAKNKDLTNGILVSNKLPPDRPPTEQYGVWPDVYTPPFHYPATPSARSLPAPPTTSRSTDPTVAALETAVAQLRERISRLWDVEEIENLVSMYGYYLDKQEWDLFTELFTEDATMEISQRGVYFGKKGVRRALELFGPQNIEKNHLHNHIQLQPVITLSTDGTHAWVRSRALSMLGTYGAVGVWGDGVYENEMVKIDGVWRYKKDHIFTTFFAPYEPGWATGSRPTPKASPKIPPDAPPTEIYESFPDVYVPKFNYVNPVTGGAAKAPAALDLNRLPLHARSRVSRIEKSITRLEDENAIENLQRAYGFYADKARWQDVADLFAENGTLELGGQGVFIGKKRVLEYMTRIAPDGLTRGRMFNHLQLQPIVDIAPDGQSALGRWRFIAELVTRDQKALWGGGVYENEYVKENGVWKIARLHGMYRFLTPYEAGWGKTALPASNSDPTFPPDAPSTAQAESYPATYVLPFHYRNPVTGR